MRYVSLWRKRSHTEMVRLLFVTAAVLVAVLSPSPVRLSPPRAAPLRIPAAEAAVADLVPTSLTAPASASTQQSISISWTVANQGSGPAQAPWHDTFHLSSDPVCCTSAITVVMDWNHTTALAAGASYTQSTTVRVPYPIPAGNYYLILVTDFTGAVPEADETNNQRAVPITITTPDLVPTAFTAPPSAVTESTISISWTVTNQGSGIATPSWGDSIYFSDIPVCCDEVAVFLGGMGRGIVLNPGASYTNGTTVTIPTVLEIWRNGTWIEQPVRAGTYYLMLSVDANNSVYEADATNNQRIVPITITTPDLVPTALSAPLSASTQQNISLAWTVANHGTGTAQPPWTDSVSLAPGPVDCLFPKPGDIMLTSVSHGTALAPGASYTQTRTGVIVPKVPAGQYDLFVQVDLGGGTNVYEADGTNNCLAVPLTITTPDLVTTAVTGPGSASTQQSISVSWTVKNQGTGPTVGGWNDTLYFSPNPTCCAGATSFGPLAHSTLAAGQSYTQTKTLTVPSVPAGTYYLIVQADSSNSLYEADEGNNERATPVGVTTPDLVPTALTASPTPVAAKQLISVSWTVLNQGTGPTPPAMTWTDSVYISPSPLCCTGATLLGSWAQSAAVPAGRSYSQTKSVTAPSLAPGTYYLIAWTDVAGRLHETDNGNNRLAVPIAVTGTSAGMLAITSVNGGNNPRAGTAFPVVVAARDTSGFARTVTSATAVSLVLASGTGVLGGTLNGTIPAGASQVTLGGVTYTKAESGVGLIASRTSGDALAPGTSGPFTVDPGAIASYAVSLSSPEPLGNTFAVSVTARDQFANRVTTDSSTLVTLSSSSGHVLFDSNADGTFGDATKALTAGTLSMNAKGTVVESTSVIARDAKAKTGSAPLTVTAASTLAFTTQPDSTPAGSAIPGPPTVAVQDSFGNTVASSTASITAAIGTNPGGGTLTGTTTKPATAGVASFSDLTISQPGSGYTLTASAPGLTGAASRAFTVTAATGTISGRVTRASDGAALSGAGVDALQAGLVKGSTTTGADGTYSMAGLAPGSFDVRASASGYHSQTQAGVSVTAGGTATVDFSLTAVVGPSIRITFPAAGSVINNLIVLVRGEVSAPVGAVVGVGVNFMPAFVEGGQFVALVPVDRTVAALTATLSSFAGALAADSIPVTVQASAADPPISLRATPAGGFAPLTIGFDLSARVGITQIALDVDGDGTPDFQGSTLAGQTFTLNAPGVYPSQAIVTDLRGQVHTATTIVEVFDRAALDQRLQAVWQGLKDALRAGNVAGAVSFIHSDARDRYREQFDRFSAATLANVDQIMTSITLVEARFAGAQYEMLRVQDGQTFSYAVWFQLDYDGLWRLRRF